MDWKYLTTFELTNSKEREAWKEMKEGARHNWNSLMGKGRSFGNLVSKAYNSTSAPVKIGVLSLALIGTGIVIGKNLSNKSEETRHYVTYYHYMDRGHNESVNAYLTDKGIKNLYHATIVSIDKWDEKR